MSNMTWDIHHTELKKKKEVLKCIPKQERYLESLKSYVIKKRNSVLESEKAKFLCDIPRVTV